MTGRTLRLLLAVVLVAVAGAALAAGTSTEAAGIPAHRGWLSVVPPLLAITLALAVRQVVVALLLGLWVGAAIVAGNPWTAFLRVGDTYLVGALADGSHAAIILFSTLLGGMVGILSRSGAHAGRLPFLTPGMLSRRICWA